MSDDWRNDSRFSKVKLSKEEKAELKKKEIGEEKTTKFIRSFFVGLFILAIGLFAIARAVRVFN